MLLSYLLTFCLTRWKIFTNGYEFQDSKLILVWRVLFTYILATGCVLFSLFTVLPMCYECGFMGYSCMTKSQILTLRRRYWSWSQSQKHISWICKRFLMDNRNSICKLDLIQHWKLEISILWLLYKRLVFFFFANNPVQRKLSLGSALICGFVVPYIPQSKQCLHVVETKAWWR